MKQTEASSKEFEKVAMRVSTICIVINLVLSLLKLFAGFFAHSGAMISDAVHSASDVLSTFVVIAGVKISSKESDQEHSYGHERYECVSSILLAGFLLATGLGIGYSGIKKIMAGTAGEDLMIPGVLALIAAVVSIVIKEWMFWYTRKAAKKINSDALMADAWHHRSDALSSIGAFIGIFGARLGYPILDPIASVVICLFIAKAAYDIFTEAVNKMVDRSCDKETEARIQETVRSVEGVKQVDLLQTRLFGSKIYVDIEIAVDGELSLSKAHGIAEAVHHAVENHYEEVKHCMVHVNPVGEK